jgi:DNA mismatch endonuclease, patch repair protein
MVDKFTKEKRSEVMSRIRGKNTRIEILVRKWLFSLGFRYRVFDKRYPGRPDIVIPKYRTVIFVHGCFWHAHENCKYFKIPLTNIEYWSEKLQRNKFRDEKNVRILESMGWRVIIVWECELKSDPSSRLTKLVCEIVECDYEES